MARYGEADAVLDEVIQLFAGKEDMDIVSNIHQLEREMAENMEARQQKLKESIKGVRKEREVTSDEEPDRRSARVRSPFERERTPAAGA